MNRFRSILFVADRSKGEQAALVKILRMAEQTGAKVTIIGMHMPLPQNYYAAAEAFGIREVQQRINAEVHDYIEDLIRSCKPVARLPAVAVREGIGYIEIVREVMREGHDLVAKAAATDRMLADVLLGSLDMQLMRHCPCAVFIMKARRKLSHARVLAAVDIGEHGRTGDLTRSAIVDLAAAAAGFEDGSLDVLHVWNLAYERDLRKRRQSKELQSVDALLKDMRRRKREELEALACGWEALEPRCHVAKGLPEVEIARFARNHRIDLVVMATVGRTGIKGFFIGNTAEKVLRTLPCSVLAIKPKGFKSPVV